MIPRPRAIASILTAACLSVLTAGPARSDLHLPEGNETGFNWTVADGAQFNWDISNIGMVTDGTDDAFDGGMRLVIGQSVFGNSRSARVSQDGREIEIGPYLRQGLKVCRRIYVDPQLGYCRWIDVFENTTDADMTVEVRTATNIGGAACEVTASSGRPLDQGDVWAMVAHDRQSQRPAVLMVLASPFSSLLPQVELKGRNQDELSCRYSVTIPAKGAAAICTFVFQRPFDQAEALMTGFDLDAELQKVPVDLRRILVNMGDAATVLDTPDLPRDDQNDRIVLPDETTWTGRITNVAYRIETAFGVIDLTADQVIGMTRTDPFDPAARVALTGGQILTGRIVSGPLSITLDNGQERTVPPDQIASAAYAISPTKPQDLTVDSPVLMLRGGGRLIYADPAATLNFQTQFGPLDLPTKQIRSVRLAGADGGLHQVVLTNGTVLSGVLTSDGLSVELAPGRPATIPTFSLGQIVFPPSRPVSPGGQAVITLRNEDVLVGALTDPELTFETDHGAAGVPVEELASMAPSQDHPPGVMRVARHDGSAEIVGRLQQPVVTVQLTEQIAVSVHPAHILSLTVGQAPPPPPGPTSQPATGEQPTMTTQQRLNDLRARIEQAMQSGAPPDEIQTIMQEYQQLEVQLRQEQSQPAPNQPPRPIRVIVD